MNKFLNKQMAARATCFAMALAAVAWWGCGSEPAWKSESFAFSSPAVSSTTGSKTNVLFLRRVDVSPLFSGRSFTYRTSADAYEKDPYADFLIPPARALEQPILTWLQNSGVFASVVAPGSGLSSSLNAEVSVNELYGDFRKATHPSGVLEIHFILYETTPEGSGKILLDKIYSRQIAMDKPSPVNLMLAWDTDLREIMQDLDSELRALP